MSRPEHAYALGAVAAGGRVRDGILEIRLRGDGQPLLAMLEAKTSSDIPALYDVASDRIRVFAPLGAVAAAYLGAPPGDHVNLRFPDMRPDMTWAFLRGMFDASGSINSPKKEKLVVRLERPSSRLLDGLLEFVGAPPSSVGKKWLRWQGVAALDLLGNLYDEFRPSAFDDEPPRRVVARADITPGTSKATGSTAAGAKPILAGTPAPRPFRKKKLDLADLKLARAKHVRRYWAWCQRILHAKTDSVLAPTVRVQLVHEGAVTPRKERVSDSGYDLTLVYEKSRTGNVVLYGTGVIIEPPQGWYFDVVARSSIVKRGYMLANNVGIIDRAYRGEILVPLLKTDPNAKDLDLPARVAQLIPRPIVHFPVETTSELTQTQRGAGGFGSTG